MTEPSIWMMCEKKVFSASSREGSLQHVGQGSYSQPAPERLQLLQRWVGNSQTRERQAPGKVFDAISPTCVAVELNFPCGKST